MRSFALLVALSASSAAAQTDSAKNAIAADGEFYEILDSCWAALAKGKPDRKVLEAKGWRRGEQNDVDKMLKATPFGKADTPLVLRTFGIQCTASGEVADVESAVSIIEKISERASAQYLDDLTSYTAEGARIFKLSDGREAMLSIQRPSNVLKLVIDTQNRQP